MQLLILILPILSAGTVDSETATLSKILTETNRVGGEGDALPGKTQSLDSVDDFGSREILAIDIDPVDYQPSMNESLRQDESDRNCSDNEVQAWRNNMQFSLDLNYYANIYAASARLIKPKMQKLYPVLTDRCIRCFTDAVFCGATQCIRFCAGRSLSEGCLKCCEDYCNPTLRKCLGVAPKDMPRSRRSLIPYQAPQRHLFVS